MGIGSAQYLEDKIMSIETITNAQLSPYERIGGAPTIRALVNRFYDLMDLEPKYLELREVHGSTLEEAGNRLYMFLSGWLGGPDLYTEQHGHPRLRSRHFPFKIGTLERDQWVACFTQSMVELNIEHDIQKELLIQIYSLAEWMRNQPDKTEGNPIPPIYAQQSRDQVINKIISVAHRYTVPCVFSSEQY